MCHRGRCAPGSRSQQYSCWYLPYCLHHSKVPPAAAALPVCHQLTALPLVVACLPALPCGLLPSRG